MKSVRKVAKNFQLIILAMLFYSTSASASYITAKLINPPNSSGFSRANPAIHVKQRLPVGDTMTATMTSNGVVITNNDGTVPTYQETVTDVHDGVQFVMPGIVNNKIVTDIFQTHSNPTVGNGILQAAAFNNEGELTPSLVEFEGLGGWLAENGYVSSNPLAVPDFIICGDIFYGVDLSIWAAAGFSDMESRLGQTFAITNGRSDALPGFLFGTSAMFFNGDGWETASLFTGTVTLDSYHEFDVPEPGSMALFGIAAIGFIARRKTSRGNMSSEN
ncbi:PEP-CTERM sorting domain-containing protein [Massilia sp. CFBP9026]|uniref:PEP-CTERM sorting domain-containing protein n=1 Tax=Massilia sp. CFBP9026 TaxID=3096536 RepID=UPI002A6B3569|nr:PEP-CTERM sorting domain-containing protein [Massilia sp. CFBP9026]MDY0960971.1 PEP-CTERM sorting domain-containing protein [Massilia sp. CFBP9026]